MKKLISAVLVITLSLSCLFTSMAAATTVTMDSEETVKGMLEFLADSIPDTQQDRIDIYNTMKMYLSTDTNMDNLIGIFEDLDNYATNPNTQPVLAIALGALDWATLEGYKEEIIFVLSVLRALPVADRNDAIAAFEAERNSATATSAGFEAALAGVYDYYIDAAADAKLGAHVIDEKVLVRLATAFTDNILFENGNSANFDVKTLGTDFETNLKTVISAHFTEINGTAVTADNGADLAVEAILAVMNSIPSAQVANVKTVLGDASISLYEAPAATPTRRPSSSNNDGYFRLPDSDTDIKPVPTPPAAEDKHIFPDTVNHWAKDYAAALAKRGIFKGYEDGNYKPDLNITREEIAVALTRALGLEAKAEAAAGTDFLDSADISEWARSAVNLMVADGVFTGYDDGNYRPHQTITREELIAVIIRVLDAEEVSDGTLDYTDAHKVAEWARDYVAKATELLIVSGYPDGSFRGANAVTRAEAAKILYQFLETVE